MAPAEDGDSKETKAGEDENDEQKVEESKYGTQRSKVKLRNEISLDHKFCLIL